MRTSVTRWLVGDGRLVMGSDMFFFSLPKGDIFFFVMSWQKDHCCLMFRPMSAGYLSRSTGEKIEVVVEMVNTAKQEALCRR